MALPWPKFPVTPGPAGPFRIKLIQCKRGHASPPRVARLGDGTVVGLGLGAGGFPVPGGK